MKEECKFCNKKATAKVVDTQRTGENPEYVTREIKGNEYHVCYKHSLEYPIEWDIDGKIVKRGSWMRS